MLWEVVIFFFFLIIVDWCLVWWQWQRKLPVDVTWSLRSLWQWRWWPSENTLVWPLELVSYHLYKSCCHAFDPRTSLWLYWIMCIFWFHARVWLVWVRWDIQNKYLLVPFSGIMCRPAHWISKHLIFLDFMYHKIWLKIPYFVETPYR